MITCFNNYAISGFHIHQVIQAPDCPSFMRFFTFIQAFPNHAFINPFMQQPIYSFIHPFIHLQIITHASIHLSTQTSTYASTHVSVHLSIHVSIHASIHASIHVSIQTFNHAFIHASSLTQNRFRGSQVVLFDVFEVGDVAAVLVGIVQYCKQTMFRSLLSIFFLTSIKMSQLAQEGWFF